MSHLCLETRIAQIRLWCNDRGLRFTPLRESVYRLILQSDKPLGAYELLEQLSHIRAKAATPPTVYRSLDFLRACGLIHELKSLNAFISCCHTQESHEAVFLICTTCHKVQESVHSATPLLNWVEGQAFNRQSAVLEVLGICATCR